MPQFRSSAGRVVLGCINIRECSWYKSDLVLDTRRAFQELMKDELIAGIEEITRRKVIAFMSANHVDPDFAVETFIMAPQADAVELGANGAAGDELDD